VNEEITKNEIEIIVAYVRMLTQIFLEDAKKKRKINSCPRIKHKTF
jgi:hypothetical protein